MRTKLFGLATVAVIWSGHASAQVQIDVDYDAARRAVGHTILEDLAVHDAAFIYYGNFCVKDNGIYVPGWAQPQDLSTLTYEASGLTARIEVLPGRKVKATLVDELQAEHQAKGKTAEKSSMSKDEYNRNVREVIARLFMGGLFGTLTCDEEQRTNPLRRLTLYPVESINGFTKLSELLASTEERPQPLPAKPKR